MILLLISGIVGYVYRSQVDEYVKAMLDTSMEHWCTSNPGILILSTPHSVEPHSVDKPHLVDKFLLLRKIH